MEAEMSKKMPGVGSFIVSVILLMASNGCAAGKEKEIGVYEIKRGDFSLNFTNWGATVISVILPDKNGKLNDVVLGYDSVEEYENDTTYFGSVVGRVANRIGGARFTLNGKNYTLVANEGHNTLHGGKKGFSDVIWSVKSHEKDSHITFTYDSFDGEQGFPRQSRVSVTYMFVGTNKLAVRMKAKSLNKPTPINLAFHGYWNLGGHASGNILSHTIQIFGSKITPVDQELIPTGQITPVQGTPYDFLKPQTIGSRINDLPNGYDINYALDGQDLHRAAIVWERRSGRKMELWTNEPGMQFYTGNKLVDVKGKGGFVYRSHAGFCLETQGFPDAVNHPNFPSQIVNPGEIYDHIMIYRFTAV
ncbi:hypothetical protein Nepgr_023779 [Nepenthes gracilis]|uniref:Aldose 1-epimerase n=1 Tax=Nepenthes gracilis TaxID=150966 RepID=A0AAD3T4U4_NEPGR|nr:hypothetical protein Nepgr_023779 [Nepenthes gracilis]